MFFIWTFVTFLLFSSTNCLLVNKQFIGYPVKNQNLTVLISITNLSPETAKDITIHDQTFNNATAFKILSGKNYQRISSLKPNHTQSISFVVSPKTGGWTKGYPAVVKYSTELHSNPITSYSTFTPLFVSNYDYFTQILYQWLSLGATIITFFALYVAYSKLSKMIKEKKK